MKKFFLYRLVDKVTGEPKEEWKMMMGEDDAEHESLMEHYRKMFDHTHHSFHAWEIVEFEVRA